MYWYPKYLIEYTSHLSVDVSPISSQVQTDKIIDLKKSAALGKGKLVQAISQTPYMGGGTNVGPALEEALKIFQNEGKYLRQVSLPIFHVKS